MIGLFARPKPRKVVQWSVAYVALAFSLIRASDVVVGTNGWPRS